MVAVFWDAPVHKISDLDLYPHRVYFLRMANDACSCTSQTYICTVHEAHPDNEYVQVRADTPVVWYQRLTYACGCTSQTYTCTVHEAWLMNPTSRDKIANADTPVVIANADTPVVRLNPTSQDKIAKCCDDIKALLLEKNKAYGNSAFEPSRIFSKASSEEQLLVRIDDKLSRIAKGSSVGEDVVLDLIGYLILLRISRQVTT